MVQTMTISTTHVGVSIIWVGWTSFNVINRQTVQFHRDRMFSPYQDSRGAAENTRGLFTRLSFLFQGRILPLAIIALDVSLPQIAVCGVSRQICTHSDDWRHVILTVRGGAELIPWFIHLGHNLRAWLGYSLPAKAGCLMTEFAEEYLFFANLLILPVFPKKVN